MHLPKVITGIIITGVSFASMIFPSNSFAHRVISNYVFPTTAPMPSAPVHRQIIHQTRVFIVTPTPTPTPPIDLTKTVVILATPTSAPTAISTTHPVQTTPTKIPTPTTVQQVTQQQAPKIPTPTNDVQAFIMNAINDYRHSQGLGSVQTNSSTCSFAATRAQEIASSFSHDGFTSRVNSHSLPYSGYSFVTENLAQTGNYKDVVNMWIASPGHAANMRADTPYVCVVQNGEYFAYEGWKQ